MNKTARPRPVRGVLSAEAEPDGWVRLRLTCGHTVHKRAAFGAAFPIAVRCPFCPPE